MLSKGMKTLRGRSRTDASTGLKSGPPGLRAIPVQAFNALVTVSAIPQVPPSSYPEALSRYRATGFGVRRKDGRCLTLQRDSSTPGQLICPRRAPQIPDPDGATSAALGCCPR